MRLVQIQVSFPVFVFFFVVATTKLKIPHFYWTALTRSKELEGGPRQKDASVTRTVLVSLTEKGTSERLGQAGMLHGV